MFNFSVHLDFEGGHFDWWHEYFFFLARSHLGILEEFIGAGGQIDNENLNDSCRLGRHFVLLRC